MSQFFAFSVGSEYITVRSQPGCTADHIDYGSFGVVRSAAVDGKLMREFSLMKDVSALAFSPPIVVHRVDVFQIEEIGESEQVRYDARIEIVGEKVLEISHAPPAYVGLGLMVRSRSVSAEIPRVTLV